MLVLFGCESLQNATAEGDTRTISFHHTHTSEELTITYKVNGRYDEDALAKINQELRDWREEKTINMDPHVLDLLWDVHRELNATSPFWIICGFRSPSTNAMLRKRSSGVAKFSQHMLGKAIDFYIPGVPLEALRDVGLRAQRGGVGFYPSSNFVHLDTGSVRHWGPHIPEAQMAKIMGKGPLTRVAGNDQPVKASFKMPNALAKLFGGGRNRDEEDDAETVASVAGQAGNAPRTAAPRTVVAETKADRPVTASVVPMPPAKPAVKAAAAAAKPATFEVASATSRQVELRPSQAASLVGRSDSPNSIINERGFWNGAAQTEQPAVAPAATTKSRPAERRAAGTTLASASAGAFGGASPWPLPERTPTGSALAYAPANSVPVTSEPITSVPSTTASARVSTVRPSVPRAAPPPVPVEPDTTVAVKRSGNRPTVVASWRGSAAPAPGAVGAAHVKPGEVFNNPWMRAMVLAPSAQKFMSTALLGAPDFRNLDAFMQKPQAAVMMTFSGDPHLGMTSDSFGGYAVVFVSTVTFNERTAALQ